MTQATKINEASAPAHYELGRAEFALNRLEQARAQLEQAAELDPHNSAPHYLLGRVLSRMGKQQDAAAEFKLTENLIREKDAKSGKEWRRRADEPLFYNSPPAEHYSPGSFASHARPSAASEHRLPSTGRRPRHGRRGPSSRRGKAAMDLCARLRIIIARSICSESFAHSSSAIVRRKTYFSV